MTIPYVADCAGYHLLGGSEAASLANIVDAAKPLVKVGTPTYPAAHYAVCNFNAELQGFRTTDSFSNKASTAIIFCTAPRNAADTAYSTGNIYPLSTNAGAYNLRWLSGSQHLWRAGTPPTYDLDTGVDPTRRAVYNPDNDPGARIFGPHRFAMHAMVDTGTETRLAIQEGHQIKGFTGPTAQATVSTPWFFGGQTVGGTRDAVIRVAAIAYYDRTLTFAELGEVYNYVWGEIVARGAS